MEGLTTVLDLLNSNIQLGRLSTGRLHYYVHQNSGTKFNEFELGR